MRYPATFTADEDGGFVVTFRDIPEAITQGDTEEEALVMAKDALITAMDFYFEEKRIVPKPSPLEDGDRLVVLPMSITAKVLLLNEMIVNKVTASDLARRLNTTPQDVNRLIDLQHATKIDTVERAIAVLGKRLELSIA